MFRPFLEQQAVGWSRSRVYYLHTFFSADGPLNPSPTSGSLIVILNDSFSIDCIWAV